MAKKRPETTTSSPATKPYQEAMERLLAGDLSASVPALLRIHRDHPGTEEAFFAEEQLARVRRLWPAEADKAGLTDAAWRELQEREAQRRATGAMPPGARAVVVILLVIAAWALLVMVAPRAAFLGRVDVPLVFRLASLIVGLATAATAFGLLRRKWEAVNVFIILAPIFLIVTFIGLTEAADPLGKVLCGAALAAEIYAAWYMSRHSHFFVH